MREILFRGKRIDNGEWVEGYYVYDESEQITEKPIAYIYQLNLHPCGWVIIPWVVDPETIGQYTGLKANGTKIFEGDVFHDESEEAFAVVVFKDGCFRLEWYGMCGTYTESGYDETGGGWGIFECEPVDFWYIHDMEVIGNIHDNPELIGGEQSAEVEKILNQEA